MEELNNKIRNLETKNRNLEIKLASLQNKPFASIYNTDNNIVYQCNGFNLTSGYVISENISVHQNFISIQKPGNYRIDFNVSYSIVSDGNYYCAIIKNQCQPGQENYTFSQNGLNTYSVTITGSIILNLKQDDVITICNISDDATPNYTQVNIQMI